MSLHKLGNIPKSKLPILKRNLDLIRNGILTNDQITNLKKLPPDEYRNSLLVILSMAMLTPNEINQLTSDVLPWWKPVLKLFYILVSILVLFLSIRSVQFYLLPRAYFIDFQQTIKYSDGTSSDCNMFDNNILLVSTKDDKEIFFEPNYIQWLLFSSREAQVDTLYWTKNKTIANNISFFYENLFSSDSLINPRKDWPIKYLKSELKFITAQELYNAVSYFRPNEALKIDVKMPSDLNYQTCIPYKYLDDTSATCFFLSLTNKESSYVNLKLDINQNKISKVSEILIPPRSEAMTFTKCIWEDLGDNAGLGIFHLFKDDSVLNKYTIRTSSNEAF